MENLVNILRNYYYNLNEISSYQRPKVILQRLKNEYGEISKSDIDNWFNLQRPYLLYKNLRRKYQKNPIVSKEVDHIWNIDLVELAYPEQKDGYRYILCVIDILI